MSIPLSSLPQRYQNQALAASFSAASKPKQLIRQKAGDGMNKTERAFSGYLRATWPTGYLHREVSLPLANGCRYKVDFLCVHTGQTGPIIHGYEVKGFMRDDAAVKLKVAASVYPWIRFFLVSRRSQKSCWKIQEVRP